MRIAVTTALLTLTAVTLPAFAAPPTRYTQAMFRRAILNDSTSADFVLVTIHNKRTNTSRLICTAGNFVQGAIHREYGIGYTREQREQVQQMILANTSRTFTLSNPEALANVECYYTPQQLSLVRKKLASRSDERLRQGKFHDVFESKPEREQDAYARATAHVLLERGILCHSGCYVVLGVS